MTTTTADTTGGSTTAEPTKLEQLRARFPWLDHLVRAGTRYTEKHGDHYAAAITYFSILALVPLLMIAFAAAGFVLANDQELLTQIQNSITAAAPPGFRRTAAGRCARSRCRRRRIAGRWWARSAASTTGFSPGCRTTTTFPRWTLDPRPPVPNGSPT